MKVQFDIVVDAGDFSAFLSAAVASVKALGVEDAFDQHWQQLAANGCDPCEATFADGVINVAPSDDLRRAFAAFGVAV